MSLVTMSSLAERATHLYERETQVIVELSRLHGDVERAMSVTLELVLSPTQHRRERNEDVLVGVIAPRVEDRLGRLQQLAGESLSAADVKELRSHWRSFLGFARELTYAEGSALDPGPTANAAATDALAMEFAPWEAALLQTLQRARAHAEADVAATQQRYHDGRLMLLAVVIAVLLLVLGIAWRLFRDVVARTREYSEFAQRVLTGTADRPLTPRGDDDLTDLGRSLNLMVAEQRTRQQDNERATELNAALRVVDDEDDSHELMRRYLERTVPGARVLVMARNNSADRLEARTPVDPDSVLATRLPDAAPRACRAVRTGAPVEQMDGTQALVGCDLCAGFAATTLCTPLLVSGEIIGSVLTGTPAPLEHRQRRLMAAAVTAAAPVVANLRNLAIAQQRARVDPLTGLVTPRAMREAISGFVARALREGAPLAALMMDLDHFKQVNDTYGHEMGDQVLAAVGAAISGAVRSSDLAARYGGEEFLVLLPATDLSGAHRVAEIIRGQVGRVRLPDGPPVISISIGVALIPDNASDEQSLTRAADRALYAAKVAGRDQVVLAEELSLPQSLADHGDTRNPRLSDRTSPTPATPSTPRGT